MAKYDVTGMTCAACSARVEKAVSSLDDVSSCSVNLLTNSMIVDGEATSEEIIKAVENAGYGASLHGLKTEKKNNRADELKDNETPKMVKRLVASVVLLIPLMYVSMGHMMWGWPVLSFLDGNAMGIALFQLVLTAAVMVINQKFFISGFKGLIHRAPNMDTLVALGSGAAFVYSLVVMFIMTVEISNGNMDAVHDHMHSNFYFESSAMILTLITVGKTLEAYSKGRTTDALKSLMKLAPDTAVVIRDGKEVKIPAEDVNVGDIFVVRAGESIPVDGVILKGESAIDESALTGESIPVDRTAGDKVSAATINRSGYIECRATSVGEDTALSKIIQMVSDASATKAPIAKIADKVSGIFVPLVIAISVITMIGWILAGQSAGFVLARGISVLVISCPCALGLATPVAIMVGSGKGAKNGILFKTAESLEVCGKTDVVCLDKTGTVTEGNPSVTDIVSDDRERLLKYAYALESKSEHPLSKAVIQYCAAENIKLEKCENAKTVAGNGLFGTVCGLKVYAGNDKYISEICNIPNDYLDQAKQLSSNGKTPLYFSVDGAFLGLIAVADTVKETSKKAVSDLKKMGITPVMITGDNEETANAIAGEVGIKNVIAKVLPDGKEEKIRMLSDFGNVAMVGDGINDAPALTRADTGIAIGAGTDVAIDAADVVLMKSDPHDIPKAISLSRRVILNIKENLFWAFIYNIIGIPIAAGILYPAFGITLNPMIAAAAMSLSSFCVVMNALRLNLVNIDKPIYKKSKKGEIDMSIFKKEKKPYIEIDGMMCEHCEAHVTEALNKIGVKVKADHNAKKAYIESGDAEDEEIRAAVEGAGYKYIKTVR
ncbi:MAG TPA: heavy metal translocating P-type ATPase [Candidatus Eubacterium faecavium]|nr:heavy metal translocating P-type ATPase [Candidatus Eubacterium faecavium]